MTDFGRRAGLGDMTKAVYDPIIDALLALAAAHKTQHQDTGSDEISVAGLLGELAAAQPSTWAKVAGKPSTFAPSAHHQSHETGNGDQINVTGLVGTTPRALLADATPGRVFRCSILGINDGTDPNTLKCHRNSLWNGDVEAAQDNIVKNGTTGNYTLNDTGSELIVAAAGFSGNVLWAAAQVRYNQGGTDFLCTGHAVANNIRLMFNLRTASGGEDLTALVDIGYIQVELAYITHA